MAWDSARSKLYGTTNNSLFEVSPLNAATTLIRTITGMDMGGLDYDPASDLLYVANDGTGTVPPAAGIGIYTIAPTPDFATGPVSRIALYPSLQVDIDGLGVGNGFVYLCEDETNSMHIYSLTSQTYVATIAQTGIGSDQGSSGATLIGNTPTASFDIQATLAAPADCSVAAGGSGTFVTTVLNPGAEDVTNVLVQLTLPAGASVISSIPAGSVTAGVLSVDLGTVGPGDIGTLSANLTLNTVGTNTASVVATATEADPSPANNSDSASTSVIAAPSGTSTATGVLSTLASSPTSLAPGLAGARFTSTPGAPIGRPFGSPDGSRFILLADTDVADAGSDNVLAVYTRGTPSTLAVVAREGTSPLIPGAGGPFPPFSFDPVQSINNAGSYAFSGLDDRPSTTDDGFIAKVIGGVVTSLAQEGTTPATSVGAGVLFGPVRGSVTIASDNTVSFFHELSGAVLASNNSGLFGNDGSALLAREGVSVPGNQVDNLGAPTAFTFKSFDVGSVSTGFTRDAAATRFLASGAINASTTLPSTSGVDQVIVEGDSAASSVVVQENVILPSSSFTFGADDATPFSAARMSADGAWLAYGDNNNDVDWVVRSGVVIATTDEPIFPGSGELFDDSVSSGTFFLAAGNARGEWVVGGFTNGSSLSNEVVVLNAATVLCRENDPVDLNANGAFDDNVYIRSFLQDRGFIGDDALYMAVALRDGAGSGGCGPDVEIGQAIIRVGFTPTQMCGTADFNGDGDTGTDLDIEAFFACLGGTCCETCGSADFNADGDTGTDLDIEAFFRVLGGGTC